MSWLVSALGYLIDQAGGLWTQFKLSAHTTDQWCQFEYADAHYYTTVDMVNIDVHQDWAV